MQPGKKMAALFVFCGMIASGKSTLAQSFAGRHGYPYYNTDRVRKELAGIEAVSRQAEEYDRGIYSREFSRLTYREMLERAAVDMAAGSRAVVLDGSYHSREEQDRLREFARQKNAECFFIYCWCSDEEVERRLAIRARDPQAVSDGRWEIYQQQKKFFQVPDEQPPCGLIRLNTEKPVQELLEELGAGLADRQAN
jgi:uncharacterized protein